jgi:hypothetical protein
MRAEFVEATAEDVLPGVVSGKYDIAFNKPQPELPLLNW